MLGMEIRYLTKWNCCDLFTNITYDIAKILYHALFNVNKYVSKLKQTCSMCLCAAPIPFSTSWFFFSLSWSVWSVLSWSLAYPWRPWITGSTGCPWWDVLSVMTSPITPSFQWLCFPVCHPCSICLIFVFFLFHVTLTCFYILLGYLFSTGFIHNSIFNCWTQCFCLFPFQPL